MKDKILFVVSLLFGLMMINSGLSKFFHYMEMEMPESAMTVVNAFVETGWLFQLVAVAEIIGGVLFILPRYRALGAIVLLPITVGIFLFNAMHNPSILALGIVLLGINVWVIVENRKKYLPMIAA